MRPRAICWVLAGMVLAAASIASAADEIQYRLSFPEPEHHWMQVEVTFPNLPVETLRVHMSRSSPGRYALHEFAKNVYDVHVTNGAGQELTATRPSLHEWDVAGHDGTVRVRYRVYGDRVDGTYAAIDTTHAHLNMPAVLMWATGLELRAIRVTFERPAAAPRWQVASQLYPTDDPLVFTAPNLQYLMDSPAEFSAFTWRTFTATAAPGDKDGPTIRIALHHTGTDAEADTFADGIKRIVEQARRVFGEFPEYEPRTYTFIVDYLPWGDGDGMEHRNSTVLTSRKTLAAASSDLLDTVAHEYFHCWNVERIRPKTLEPFDFEQANVSGELWLAEGFTSYYDGLLMSRAGLMSLDDFLLDLSSVVTAVATSPALQFRSAEDMSRLAPFVDSASWLDRTNWSNTFISYYTFGAALGAGFDLAIREHTDGRVTLDDFMRAMWRTHGKPGGRLAGYVDRPYTLSDVRDRLAEVTGDRAFADDLISRYVEGREVMDYTKLLAATGLVMRRQRPGQASLGLVAWDLSGSALTIAAPTTIRSAAYAAGLDQGDRVTSLAGTAVATAQQLEAVLAQHKPGDRVKIAFVRRGAQVVAEVTLQEDPRLEVVTVEATGGTPSAAQRTFRERWLRGN